MDEFLDGNKMAQLYILLDIVIASLLAGVVGYEREHKNKPAGLRTNMIIGGAACLIVSITVPLIDFLENANTTEIITTDPIRVLHALVVGISFIGAGTIIKEKSDKISGLTTAATLIYSLGIGITVALHYYILAVGVSVIALIINYLLFKFVSSETSAEDNSKELIRIQFSKFQKID